MENISFDELKMAIIREKGRKPVSQCGNAARGRKMTMRAHASVVSGIIPSVRA